MVKSMHTWELAKLLLDGCDSPGEVDEVLNTLSDTLALRELRTMLSAFASNSGSGSETLSLTSANGPTTEPQLVAEAVDEGIKRLSDASRTTMAEQLESLFRSGGMTNGQVQQWFKANLQIDLLLNGRSLRHYLMRVLKEVDLETGNRVLAAAQGLGRDYSTKSEISDYWDHLDRRFSDVQ